MNSRNSLNSHLNSSKVHQGATRALLGLLYGPFVARAAEPVSLGWRLPGRWYRAVYARGDHLVIRYDPAHESHLDCLKANHAALHIRNNPMVRFESWRQIMNYTGVLPVSYREDVQITALAPENP